MRMHKNQIIKGFCFMGYIVPIASSESTHCTVSITDRWVMIYFFLKVVAIIVSSGVITMSAYIS